MLKLNPNMPPARIERIERGIERQIERAIKHIERQPSYQLAQEQAHHVSLKAEVEACRNASRALETDMGKKDIQKGGDERSC